MSSIMSSVLSLAPWHLAAFSTLFGTQIYQSFLMTKICFRALPPAPFVALQARVFPAYFALQSAATVVAVATYPPASVKGLLLSSKTDAVALGVMLATSLLNFFVFGPGTKRAMLDRAQQEAREGRSHKAPGDRSEAMHAVCRRFSRAHAMSIHLNFIGIVASAVYLFSLASRVAIREE